MPCLEQCSKEAPIKLSFNLTSVDLLNPNIVTLIHSSIQEAGVNPKNIVIELTESVLIDDPQHAIETLNKLKEIGVRLAIDDYGSGYSSLGYIWTLA